MRSGKKLITVRPTSSGDQVREYHIHGDQLGEFDYASFYHPMWGDSQQEFDALGNKGSELASLLMDKRYEKQVTRTTFRPQSVRVYITPTVDWATVENTIVIPALKQILGENVEVVQYGTIRQRELALA